MLEKTSDQFDPSSALGSHFFDIEKNQRLLAAREEKAAAQQMANIEREANSVSLGIESHDANIETQVKNDKKARAKEQLKIMKQFDSMSESFQRSSTKIDQEFTETAGQIRKRER